MSLLELLLEPKMYSSPKWALAGGGEAEGGPRSPSPNSGLNGEHQGGHQVSSEELGGQG